MRNEFVPFFRSTVGFDRLLDSLVDRANENRRRLSALQHREDRRGCLPCGPDIPGWTGYCAFVGATDSCFIAMACRGLAGGQLLPLGPSSWPAGRASTSQQAS